jgi:hypothetical protein
VINDTSYLSGRYGYFGEGVPRFGNAGYHTTYPVSRANSLDRWAGEYILFQKGRDLQIGFDGADEANFHTFMVAKDTIGHRLLLDTIELDSLQAGSISVPGSDTGYQSVWLVPASHYPYDRMSYAYTATAVGIMEENPKPQTPTRHSPDGGSRRGSAQAACWNGVVLHRRQGREVRPGVGSGRVLA